MTHDHHHHHHHHHSPTGSESKLLVSIILNLTITVAEVVGGILANSLALLSDAIHNFSDSTSLIISYISRRLSKKEANDKKSFGYKRAEIIGAFINLVTLMVVAILLIKEAVYRYLYPEPIVGLIMLIVAVIGLLANVFTAVLLYRDSKSSLNLRSTFIHIVSDAVSSVGVIVGAVMIMQYQILWVDPLITLLVSFYILYQGWGMLKEVIDILMQSTPHHIDVRVLSDELMSLSSVAGVHHIHIWQLDDDNYCFEGHIVLNENETFETMEIIKADIKQRLLDTFKINHATIEFEGLGGPDCGHCHCDFN